MSGAQATLEDLNGEPTNPESPITEADLQQHCICQLECVCEGGAAVLHLSQQLVVGDDDQRVHVALQLVNATNSLSAAAQINGSNSLVPH